MDGLCIAILILWLCQCLWLNTPSHTFRQLHFQFDDHKPNRKPKREQKFFCRIFFLLSEKASQIFSMLVFYITFYLYFCYFVHSFLLWWAFDIACECVYNVTVFVYSIKVNKTAIEISCHSFCSLSEHSLENSLYDCGSLSRSRSLFLSFCGAIDFMFTVTFFHC